MAALLPVCNLSEVTFRTPGVLDYDANPSQILTKPHVGCDE